jgi:poly-gamma-glutamate capsule biosynthesis protein CapA/YwtB (metallophosphatase superfamily)
MTRRHARRSRVPFVFIVVGLGIAVTAAAWSANRDREGAAASAPGESSTATSASPDVAAVEERPSPSAAASVTPTPAPKRRIVIHGTGDVSLDPSYIPAFTSFGYEHAWSGLEGLFRRDDLTVINHECPSTDIVDPFDKEFVFRCDPQALRVARRFGVEVASLANNHGFDHGPEALVDSIRNMERAGIVPVGAGRSAREADAPRYLEAGGWRIAVIGVGEVLDPVHQVAVGNEPGTAVGHDFGRALRAIRLAERNADLVVVTIHWGTELDTVPRAYQVDEARRMVDAGADVIFGHHAHRLQPMDRYRGRPIFYGLGNFVWPNFSVEGSTTAVARVVVTPDGRISGRLLPAFITSPGHPVLRR